MSPSAGTPSFTRLQNQGPLYRPDDTAALFLAGEKIRFKDVVAAFAALGISRGDTVVLHSESTTIGKLGDIRNRRELADAILLAAYDLLGPQGTLILPTFTYSFTRKLDFDPQNSKPTIGILPERFLEWPGAVRSNNPMFSYTAVGARAEEWMASDISHCFGAGSINAKLIQGECKFCFFGSQGLQMITAVHAVEFELSVPYRSTIQLNGNLQLNGAHVPLKQEFFARKLELSLVADFSRLEERLKADGKMRLEKLGWGSLGVAKSRDIGDAARHGYASDPGFLTRVSYY